MAKAPIRYRCFQCQEVIHEGELHRVGIECRGHPSLAMNVALGVSVALMIVGTATGFTAFGYALGHALQTICR